MTGPRFRYRRSLPWLLALALAACGSEPAAPPDVAAINGLQTVQVDRDPTAAGRGWDGVVEAVRSASLSAQTGGRVVEVLRDINDPVAAGDVLVRLSDVEQQSAVDAARAALRAAEAAAGEAETTLRRYRDLAQRQHVSPLQLDQLQASRDAAVAARDAARAQVANAGQQSDYTTIRAPFAGIVSRRDVEPGESVAVGQPLVTVFAPGALRIEVSLPQGDADAIRGQPSAAVTLADGRQIEAAEVIVFPTADPAAHAVTVRVLLPPIEPEAAPGTTAKVTFPALGGEAVLRIPSAALVQRGELSAVYVFSDGQLGLRQLRLGARDGNLVDVISGLQAGETIAIDPVAARQALVAARRND